MTNALSCSTSPAAVRPNPLTTAPVPFRKKARSSRAAFNAEGSAAFRLRFRDGRFAAAPFPPSLRLRFTFPFAETQAEAKLTIGSLSRGFGLRFGERESEAEAERRRERSRS